MLKILGNRVYPQEVTAQVLSLPGIRDAVVVGVPRPDGQTALVAFLVPAAPGEPTAGTVRKLLNARLPAYMVPREFVFVDRIPRTATGKADPHTLVATYASGAAHP
jgi:acyl-coenzyme A synthetase/AMP-(fatty) acid ligase